MWYRPSGIALTPPAWNKLKTLVAKIDEALKKVDSNDWSRFALQNISRLGKRNEFVVFKSCSSHQLIFRNCFQKDFILNFYFTEIHARNYMNHLMLCNLKKKVLPVKTFTWLDNKSLITHHALSISTSKFYRLHLHLHSPTFYCKKSIGA